MLFYLSSYLLGNQTEFLREKSKTYPKIGYISNAMDFKNVDLQRLENSNRENVKSLENLGFQVETINLQDYFDDSSLLENKLNELSGLFVRGGNVFALRQAMKLSGLDNILLKFYRDSKSYLYIGYSAGICVLSPNLKGLELVDSAQDSIYLGRAGLVWQGLNIINYSIAPHYKSDHGESELIGKVVEYFIEQKVLFKVLRDGEVEIFENN